MRHAKTALPWMFLVLLFFSLVAICTAPATAENIRLILVVDKSDYNTVAKIVQGMQGTVNFSYKYANAIAVTVPAEKVKALLARPEVRRILKDEVVTLPEPKLRDAPGVGILPSLPAAEPEQSKALEGAELKAILSGMPENYYPYENTLTHAYQFSAMTSHYGEDVVVAIVDAGVSKAAIAVAGSGGQRIVGAENFTGDGIPADSKLNSSHGTMVASCVGASAIFGFPHTHRWAKAIAAYVPGAVIPDYFGPGIDGIPMVGQAPMAKFYALKVFPAGSNSTARSIIAAAIERAIELKKLYNAGTGGSNIRVINLSLGGSNLYAGNDPLYAPLMEEAEEAGIVVTASSGNEGPAGLTVGTPGDSKEILTAAATTDAPHARVYGEIVFGTGGGLLLRPVNNHITADFSSRGPTADGRMVPNITAPGDWRFVQAASGGVSLASGTSFSTPTVAGAAALLISAHPGAEPDNIRAALLLGANPDRLDDMSTNLDQGHGFLDVTAAEENMGDWDLEDNGRATPLVAANLVPFGISVIDAPSYFDETGWLLPGQRKEYHFQTTQQPLSGMTVVVTVTADLPPDQQNQIWGDDAIVTVASAKTSRSDYRAYYFVPGSKTIVLDGDDLDMGLTRVTITGDYTNAGRIRAAVSITRGSSPQDLQALASGFVGQGSVKSIPVTIPVGKPSVRFVLGWLKGWESWPTNDLDLYVVDPLGNLFLADNDGDGDLDGLSLDTPERITVANPAAGVWTLFVEGFAVWRNDAQFLLFSNVNAPAAKLAKESVAGVPSAYVLEQNYPNPFNPSTVIRYGLPEDSRVQLAVYNILGQEVVRLVDAEQPAGYHEVVFGNPGLSSGVYFYRLTAGGFQDVRKLLLAK